MIEFLSSADNVLALRFEGSLSDAELQSVTSRLEAMLAAHEKTHVYVEGVHFGGIEATALARYLPHAAGFLKHRKRFGRVAVVSDQDWVRFLTKLESALLPDISYETFRMDESEQARRWVDGEAKLPHGSKFKIIDTDKPEVTGFEISGKISAAEMGAVADHYNAILSQGRPIRLLARMTNYAGAALGALADLDYLKMKLGMLKDLERYAVVGGPDWMRFAVEGLGPMFKMEIRHFPGDQEMAAWEWLGASPVRERAIPV